ncbi:MAG: hypothetical protein VKL39_03755 [Leptolyngbyaceae bacterium]|nr:hypothetical protein [Leptolyngbyaceae bacterium]
MQTEFEFTLPKGYLDDEGGVHRMGTMRLSTAMDEIVPLRDPRVRSNPAYATVIILSRVITQLGAVDEVTPRVVERFFACDLNYLQKFYRQINELDDEIHTEMHNSRHGDHAERSAAHTPLPPSTGDYSPLTSHEEPFGEEQSYLSNSHVSTSHEAMSSDLADITHLRESSDPALESQFFA